MGLGIIDVEEVKEGISEVSFACSLARESPTF